jgi:hypothetical protein
VKDTHIWQKSTDGLVVTFPLCTRDGEAILETVPHSIALNGAAPTTAEIGVRLAYTGVQRDSAHIRILCRYGCDHEHWSPWEQMKPTNESTESQSVQRIKLECNERARATFNELQKEYRETDRNWRDDAISECEWIAKNHPAYFDTNIPMIGYVELRIIVKDGKGVVAIRQIVMGSNWIGGGMEKYVPGHTGFRTLQETWGFQSQRRERK